MEPNFSAEQKLELQRFGKRLAELRKERGWSQEKLALESGIARSYVGGVERGQRNVALLNILRLARTLGCEPGQFFKNLILGSYVPAADPKDAINRHDPAR